MELKRLLDETDALTYANALRVTLTEVKDCVSEIEQLSGYLNSECDKARKLMRKADNQYRMIAKLVQQGEAPLATNVTIDTNLEIEELMQNE